MLYRTYFLNSVVLFTTLPLWASEDIVSEQSVLSHLLEQRTQYRLFTEHCSSFQDEVDSSLSSPRLFFSSVALEEIKRTSNVLFNRALWLSSNEKVTQWDVESYKNWLIQYSQILYDVSDGNNDFLRALDAEATLMEYQTALSQYQCSQWKEKFQRLALHIEGFNSLKERG